MQRLLFLALAVAGCSSSDEIAGPFTGESHRYVVDGFTLPINGATANELASDLDGDGVPDNAFGMVTSLLVWHGNLNLHATEMIRAGALASYVEIVADDLAEDPTVGVRYIGAEGDDAVQLGGAFVGGTFASNRTATSRLAGAAQLRVPVFAGADPSSVELIGMQLDLIPDGQGGFHARIAGGVREADALSAAYVGSRQLLASDPQRHREYWWLVDQNHDGVLVNNESSILTSLLAPDVTLWYAGGEHPVISVGLAMHLSPCPEGSCITQPVVEACFDRMLDGDEAGVDCGGSCAARCPGGQTCRDAADCQSGACEGGICRTPSCTNGRLDGFEASTDCGGGCDGCALDRRCTFDEDCASGVCADNHACQ